ncbi:response regulator transcription factor [Actinoplanes sp. CA-030573]|uniref:response regulator transcription factor n=1 Tax=Actinoplanes sp. CA-030573 TaxID=3239898 RepID=UPI003D8D94F0
MSMTTGDAGGRPATAPLRVVLVDDQTLVREAFALLLDRLPGIEVVGTAADGSQALTVVAATAPDVVLVDLRMPGWDGAETTRRLRAAHPHAAVLVLTTYLHDASVMPALHAGALGVVGKDSTPQEVADAIRFVHAGHPVLPGSAQRALLTTAQGPDREPRAALSSREVEVLRLVAEGHRNAQIAARLGVSVPTVKTHLNNVFAKLGVRDRTAAVAAAVALGLLA